MKVECKLFGWLALFFPPLGPIYLFWDPTAATTSSAPSRCS